MNKIKLMYEIAKTMRDKNEANGSLNIEYLKDQTAVFRLDNDFSKDFTTGLTKAAIKSEINSGGNHFKHESTTEFTRPADSCQHGQRFAFFQARHPHFHHFHACSETSTHGGLKDLFSGLTLAFDILSKIKAEEQPDNTILISLEMEELPADLQKALSERMKKEHRQKNRSEEQYSHHPGSLPANHPGCHLLLKELSSLQDPKFTLCSRINKNYEIEAVDFTLKGKSIEELQEVHNLELRSTIVFNH